jgi:hypothetical protein
MHARQTRRIQGRLQDMSFTDEQMTSNKPFNRVNNFSEGLDEA